EREARIRRAQREVRQQELEVERIFEQVRSDVTTRYYDLQNADASVAIAQAAIEDTTQSLRDAQLLENAGLGTRFDTLRSELDLARANQALTTAIAQQRTARRQLATVLGVGQQIELTAADEIEETGRWPLSLEETIVQAYKNRAELEQQLINREISEQDREIALSALRPTVAFAANWRFDDDFDDTIHVANGYSFQGIVRWRLFDGGRAWAEARQANRNIDIADTNFANQREQIRVEVEESYFTMISSRENIGTARQNVVFAEESLRLARLRFQAGVGTQTDVINSQRDLTDARSEFLQAIITYNQSLNALQRSVSRLPDNRLFERP
ncbi:MAG: TolC family protein, partial [Xenococcus sp. (in: cyanobacteria)]